MEIEDRISSGIDYERDFQLLNRQLSPFRVVLRSVISVETRAQRIYTPAELIEVAFLEDWNRVQLYHVRIRSVSGRGSYCAPLRVEH